MNGTYGKPVSWPNSNVVWIGACSYGFCFGVGEMLSSASQEANSNLSKTGWKAFQLSLAGFLVPFAFVYNHAMLFLGSTAQPAWVTFTCIIGVTSLAVSLSGILFTRLTATERVLFFIAAILLVVSEGVTDFLGFGLFACLVGTLFVKHRARGPLQAC